MIGKRVYVKGANYNYCGTIIYMSNRFITILKDRVKYAVCIDGWELRKGIVKLQEV